LAAPPPQKPYRVPHTLGLLHHQCLHLPPTGTEPSKNHPRPGLRVVPISSILFSPLRPLPLLPGQPPPMIFRDCHPRCINFQPLPASQLSHHPQPTQILPSLRECASWSVASLIPCLPQPSPYLVLLRKPRNYRNPRVNSRVGTATAHLLPTPKFKGTAAVCCARSLWPAASPSAAHPLPPRPSGRILGSVQQGCPSSPPEVWMAVAELVALTGASEAPAKMTDPPPFPGFRFLSRRCRRRPSHGAPSQSHLRRY
jgi:hypothetical protein